MGDFGDASSGGASSKATAPIIVLREGTIVGPVRGRFVLRGQRWRFIVKSETTQDHGQLSQLLDTGNARKISDTPVTLLSPKANATGGLAANASGVRSIDRRETDRSGIGQVAGENSAVSRVLLPTFESMIVIENLMLGRIASAIEDDPNDDHWTITGRITEFQDDNRLMLITVHRAASSITQ